MSKERELLKQAEELIHTISIMTSMDGVKIPNNIGIALRLEIQGLLAQPEQEQEPVAWRGINFTEAEGDWLYRDIEEPFTDSNYRSVGEALYLAPPQRKPLSEEEIFAIGYKAGFAIDAIENDFGIDYGFLDEDGDVDNEPYFKLVRAIEKAHGIGL